MLKNRQSLTWKLMGIALLVSMSGCAAAYHDYESCCIPYLYCTPQPLPYVAYEGCHCPTPGASLYFQQHGAPDITVTDSEIQTVSPTPVKAAEPQSPK